MYDPIRVDIYTIRHLGHDRRVRGSGEMIWEKSLPRLFFRKTKNLSPIVGAQSTMPVKKSGMGILNTLTSSQEKYLISQRGSVKLVRAVTGGRFSNADHLRALGEERRNGKKYREAVYETKVKDLVRAIKFTGKRLTICSKITGAWLSVCGATVSGTVLPATEFQYLSCARYNVSPLNLQIHSDGCGTEFGVTDALICIIGGLVIARHNKIRDKLFYISRRAFTSAYVRAKPLTQKTGPDMSKRDVRALTMT